MFKKVNKQSRLYEFWYLFLLIIGICIGSGIYVKNQELLDQTKSPWIATVLWLVIGLVCVASIITFMEIAKSTEKEGNGTVSNWCKMFLGRKFASLVAIFHVAIYMPAYQSIFVSLTIGYFLNVFQFQFTGAELLIIYLTVGISLFIAFAVVNIYAPVISRNMHFSAMMLKFIPLIIAFFAGFILVIIGQGSNNGMGMKENSDSLVTMNFLGGMGAVLFSFDGYIFTANTQKSYKNKEVVSKAIILGLVFITIFYVLMAFSLFLGADGTVTGVLEKVFAGFKKDPSSQVKEVSRIITTLIMFSICLVNINMFTHFSTSGLVSDYNAKLVYINKDRAERNGFKAAACIQLIVSIAFFSTMVIIAVLTYEKGGIHSSAANDIQLALENAQSKNPTATIEDVKIGAVSGFNMMPMKYIGIMSSVAVILLFLVIAVLIISAMVNRKTQKLKLEKVRFFWTASIISSVIFIFITVMGLLVFIVPDLLLTADKREGWVNGGGMISTLIMIVSILSVVVIWLLQEYKFKKNPFENGFVGEVDKNMATNNWLAAKIKKEVLAKNEKPKTKNT